MNEMGVDAELLVLKRLSNDFEKRLMASGVQVYYTDVPQIYSPRQIFKIASFLKKNQAKYDLIHSHLFPSKYWLIFAHIMSSVKAKLIMTEHSTHNRRRDKIILRWLEELIYRRYEKIICISEPARESLAKWLPEIFDKTVVIPNGVNIKSFKDSSAYPREDLVGHQNESAKIILMVASLTQKKDHETVLRAAALLPGHYHIVFVGEGKQRTHLEDVTRQLGLLKRIHYLGVRSDVERLIKSADLFVVSSHWEGFGLVAIEAMAGGLPVIASDVPGLSDIVRGYGVLFPAGDEKMLAAKIREALESDEYYEELKFRGLQRAEDFSLEKMASQYVMTYKEVIKK